MDESPKKKAKEGRPSAFPEELGLGVKVGHHFPIAVHALLKKRRFKRLMGKMAMDPAFEEYILGHVPDDEKPTEQE